MSSPNSNNILNYTLLHIIIIVQKNCKRKLYKEYVNIFSSYYVKKKTFRESVSFRFPMRSSILLE